MSSPSRSTAKRCASFSTVGPCRWETAASYAEHVARGLAAAHGNGVVHRDLKPENILVASDGSMKIIGFGLAAVTQNESAVARGVPLGTLRYMSPEQLRGAAADQRSDMFTFGAIVYEMLAGAPAFSGGTLDTMTAVLESGPLPPSTADVPPALTRIVELSLKKDPDSRLLAEDIAIALQDLQSQPEPPPTVEAPASPANPRRFVRTAAVLGAVALAAALSFWLLRPVGTTGMSTSTTPPSATPSSETPGSATLGSAAPASPPPAVAAEPPSSTPPAPTLSLVAAGPRLAWFDREGTELGSFGEPGDYGDVSLSPDGTRVAVSVREPGSEAADIWVFDVASGAGTRVTGDPADDIAPVWSSRWEPHRVCLFAGRIVRPVRESD